MNDGSAQRSMVRSLTVTFDAAVTVDLAGVTVNNSLGGTSSFNGVVATVNGKTTLTVSFPDQLGGSVGDGLWVLKIAAGAVKAVSGGTPMAATGTVALPLLLLLLSGFDFLDVSGRVLLEIFQAGFAAELDLTPFMGEDIGLHAGIGPELFIRDHAGGQGVGLGLVRGDQRQRWSATLAPFKCCLCGPIVHAVNDRD